MRSPDEQLEEAWRAFDPSADQVSRIAARLEDSLAVPTQSLVAEWLELLRLRPLTHGALAVFSSAAFVATTPLGALLIALLRSARAG